MKYVIVIPDGAADEPRPELNGRTPLQAARKPAMDAIAREGILGLSRNVPDCFLPASDVATLSLFGYDPVEYYTGRAPLEAAAMGLKLGPHDWAVRCNLMTILDGQMTDFTAGHVTSDEAKELIAVLNQTLATDRIEFHPGVSYRNLMIYRGDPDEVVFGADTTTTPPHDVPDRAAIDHLPRGTGSELLRELMRKGSDAIRDHAVNRGRVAAGKRPANAVWLWGQGKAPALPRFDAVRGLKGAIISAVDLVRGVGVLAGWDRIDVPTATGYLDTDYAAKGIAAITALQDHDIVCVHIEAPDEASHEGRADAKVEAIERIDEAIIAPILAALKVCPSWRILTSPDHSTLLSTRAHDRAPVPWAMAGTGIGALCEGSWRGSGYPYDEIAARAAGGPTFDQGFRLMDLFLKANDA